MTTTPAAAAGRPLPAWPLVAPIVTYPLWWLSGIGEQALVGFAAAAALILAHRGDVRVPRGFGVWLLFVLWVVLSGSQLDSAGRGLGFLYRLLLLGAVTVYFVYVYNARAGLTVRRVCGAATVLLAWMTVGGLLGLLFPLFEWTTPLAYVLPRGVLGNDLVHDIAYRRLTQLNPDAWNAEALSPRPSAPFLYTNGWGNVYSLVLPLVIVYLTRVNRREWRFWATVALVPVSVVPAVMTLNRGMFLGLAVGGAFWAARAAVHGHVKALAAILSLTVVVATAVGGLSVGQRIESRNETVSSVDVRMQLYAETLERTLESPLLGYGAPRPSEIAGAPSAGTQGQLWATMFAHGLPALALLVAWFVLLLAASLRSTSTLALAGGTTIFIGLVELVYYGFLPFGFLVVMLAGALVMRERVETPVEVEAPPGTMVA